MNDSIITMHFKTAQEFVDALHPTHSIWNSKRNWRYNDYMFRGHANNNGVWELKPRAFRLDTVLSYDTPFPRPVAVLPDQCWQEANMLMHFFATADKIGLPIPGDGPHYRCTDCFDENFKQVIEDGEWPSPVMWEMLALAQHHGVPTRMLDFSRRPTIAAWFAASGCFEHARAEGGENWENKIEVMNGLTVWAINCRFLLRPQHGKRFQIVTVQNAQNPFCRAQRGCFLLDTLANKYISENQRFPDLAESLAKLVRDYGPGNGEPEDAIGAIMKMTVPASEAPDILLYLEQEDINVSTLQPTYGNAVKQLEMRRDAFYTI